jgi:hypothetical protein
MNCARLCCTVLYCTVLYCTVLYCTVLYCTVLFCTLERTLLSFIIVSDLILYRIILHLEQSLLDIVQSNEKSLRVSFSPVGSAVDCFTHTVLRVASASKSSRGDFPSFLLLPSLPTYPSFLSFFLRCQPPSLTLTLTLSPAFSSRLSFSHSSPSHRPSPSLFPFIPFVASFTTWLLRAGAGGIATEFCGKSSSEKTVLMKFLQSLLDIQVIREAKNIRCIAGNFLCLAGNVLCIW